MLPEVFECPQCQRQFVFELFEPAQDCSIYCPQCKRYLGEKDLHFILRTEIEELSERIRFERDRLEKTKPATALAKSTPSLRSSGEEANKVINILRKALTDLDALKKSYQ